MSHHAPQYKRKQSQSEKYKMAGNSLIPPAIMLAMLLLISPETHAGHDYRDALRKSILFFEGQRSGKLPPDQRLKWRRDSALRDGSSAGVDLTGGYYDAGDNVASGSLSFLLLTYSNYLSHANKVVACGEFIASPALLRQVAKRQVSKLTNIPLLLAS